MEIQNRLHETYKFTLFLLQSPNFFNNKENYLCIAFVIPRNTNRNTHR